MLVIKLPDAHHTAFVHRDLGDQTVGARTPAAASCTNILLEPQQLRIELLVRRLADQPEVLAEPLEASRHDD